MLFIKLGTLEFAVYMFRIVMSSLLIFILNRMKCPLFFWMSFSLKSLLSDIRIAMYAYFLVPLACNTFL